MTCRSGPRRAIPSRLPDEGHVLSLCGGRRAAPPKLFTKLIDSCLFEPENFQPSLAQLFEQMKAGGRYGSDKIDAFNGGLFDEKPPLALTDAELRTLRRVAEKPWAGVEPTIFGTLFERILDPQEAPDRRVTTPEKMIFCSSSIPLS